MIFVSKPILPNRAKLDKYIDTIYETVQLTNNGPLVQELTRRLAEHLGIKSECLVLVGNGSLALHLAYKVLGLRGEVITTPFSFVATTNTLVWDGLRPVFADISKDSLNIDPSLIEKIITKETSAILPVHVFGNPCDVAAIQSVADRHDLRVVYDASHCFDSKLNGESVLAFGDVGTLSFHATKLFHCVEGGAVITRFKSTADQLRNMINFGINRNGELSGLGTNAKMSEFHAAMGLAVLDEWGSVVSRRKACWNLYHKELQGLVELQSRSLGANNSYAYFPMLLESESKALDLIKLAKSDDIQVRRYFYPSLNTLSDYAADEARCPNSESVAKRIVCLPLYADLELSDVSRIIEIVKRVVC